MYMSSCYILEMTAHIQVSSQFFRCLKHIVNLTNVAIITHIMKIAAIKNANAIWEYNLELPGN